MSDPSEDGFPLTPEDASICERFEVVVRGNLIYLPFAAHLADVDEAAEEDRKAA